MRFLLTIIYNLLKDTLIKNEDELDFKSSNFDARKALLILFVMGLVVMVILLTVRLFNVVGENITLQEQLIQCQVPPSDDPKNGGIPVMIP